MLTVACFKWFDRNGRYNDRFLYTAEHVNRLRRMVDRHLSTPHDFVCITDDAGGLDAGIRSIPLARGFVERVGHRYPKLMIFRPDAGTWLGDRILMLDLDTVIVGPLDPLLDRASDFVAWQEPDWGKPGRGKYNSSMVLLKAGSHPEVWNRFEERNAGTSGAGGAKMFSDQGWIAEVLGERYPVWTRDDGVLSFKLDIARRSLFTRRRDLTLPTRLPPHARIVFFHGGIDPSAPAFRAAHPWIGEHLR
jgi:hypothetical protein